MSTGSSFEMVMPFVSCVSNGGVYEDEAWVAGFEMGKMDCELRQRPAVWDCTIMVGNREQLDLIAMKHGYTATWEETPADPTGHWASARLTRGN